MTKTFCDQCNAEFEPRDYRLTGHIGNLSIQIITGVSASSDNAPIPTWNKGDFCTSCILDVLYKLDPRMGKP